MRPKNAWVNNLRLRVLAAASLAAGLSASHFDGWVFEGGFEKRVKCRKMMSELRRKSQEQVGERVEAEDLYKDAVRVTLGGIKRPPRSRTRLEGAANDQSDQTFPFG
jgi:hypothetical protein